MTNHSPHPTSITAGIAQFDVRLGDVAANQASAGTAVRELADAGADLAVLPEMWSCGFDNANLPKQARTTPSVLEQVTKWAEHHHMVIAGSLPETDGRNIFNTLYVIDKDGTRTGAYRKIHLFSPTGEDRFFAAGSRAVVCDTSVGKLGLMICYDLRFPELCRTLALQGATTVVVSAQWPNVRIQHWEVLLQARAIENQLFVVASNRCGKDPSIEYGGSSAVVSPLGNVVSCSEDRQETVVSTLDFKELDDFRTRIPCLKGRIPEAYT